MFYRKARLSVTKFIALQALAVNGMAMTLQIATWTHREWHNTTTLVERLKRDGLVTAEGDGTIIWRLDSKQCDNLPNLK